MSDLDVKIDLVKHYTTVTDEEILRDLFNSVKTAFALVKNTLKIPVTKTRNFFNTLAVEIIKKTKSLGIENYNAFIGENFDTAIRYEKTSLATFQWENVKIMLFRCPANPIHSLEENVNFDPEEAQIINEKYIFNEIMKNIGKDGY